MMKVGTEYKPLAIIQIAFFGIMAFSLSYLMLILPYATAFHFPNRQKRSIRLNLHQGVIHSFFTAIKEVNNLISFGMRHILNFYMTHGMVKSLLDDLLRNLCLGCYGNLLFNIWSWDAERSPNQIFLCSDE